MLQQVILSFKRIPAFVGITGILAFIYVVLRALLLSFTYDEAFTFLNFVLVDWELLNPENYMAGNNHPLNSILMNGMFALFGAAEWSLRLPNVLSFLLYMFFSWKFAKTFSWSYLRYLAFFLLISSGFLLDFFSVARGYGLMMAFLLGALWYAFQGTLRYLSIFYFFLLGLLAVFSNLVSIYFICAASLVYLIRIFAIIENGKKKNLLIVGTLLSCSIILLVSIPWATALKEIGSLFFGGKEGFWNNTVISLIKCYSYRPPEGSTLPTFLMYAVGTLSFLSLIVYLKSAFLQGIKVMDTLFVKAWMFLLFSSTITTLSFLHAHNNYLIERTALPFLPVFLLAVVGLVESIDKKWIQFCLFLLLFCFAGVRFIQTANFSYTEQWKEDSETKQMFLLINQDPRHDQPVMGDYIFEPVFNYYKFLYQSATPMYRRDELSRLSTFVFTMKNGRMKINENEWEQVFFSPGTGNKVLRRVKEEKNKVLYSDFENYGNAIPDPVPVHRSTKNCFSAPLCGFTNGGDAQYCSWIELPVQDTISAYEFLVRSSGKLKWNRGKRKGGIVIEVKDSAGVADWTLTPFYFQLGENGKWTDFNVSMYVHGRGNKGTQVNAYVWNFGSAELYLDDIKTEIRIPDADK